MKPIKLEIEKLLILTTVPKMGTNATKTFIPTFPRV
jgi:hypothetical protein